MPANIARPGDSNTPQEWWRSLPVVTKYLVSATVLSTLACYMNLTNYGNFALIWPLVWKQFQIWRLFGCAVFAGSFSFPYFFHVLMLYQNSLRYETEPYNTGGGGSSADYLWMICFSMICFFLISAVFDMFFMAESLLFTIIYVASRRNADGISSFFGLKFKTLYVPWINVAYRLLIGAGIMNPLIGIAVGHLYYFLVEVMPGLHHVNVIKTPKWCISAVEYLSGRTVPVAPSRGSGTAAAAPNVNRGGYNWGTGRTLGQRDN